MPLHSSFKRSRASDVAIRNVISAIGNPGENALDVISAKRISDNASFGLVCSEQALYLLRSESSSERYPWENVSIFAFYFSRHNTIEIILGKTTRALRTNGSEPEITRSTFQISRDQRLDAEHFLTTCKQNTSRFIVHSEAIEVLPNIRPRFNWRVFSGAIEMIHETDIDIKNPSAADKVQMNTILRNRITELKPRFSEIEQTYAFNEDGLRTWGDPAIVIDADQLVDEAELPDCDLSGEDLSFKDLMKANFTDANLQDCNFRFAYLAFANLKNANLSNCDLRGAILHGSNLEGANLSNCNLAWATLSNANLQNATLVGGDLRNALLDGASLINADLSNSKMGFLRQDKEIKNGRKKRRFALAPADELKGTYLVGADLTNANLLGAKIDFSSCYFEGSDGRMAHFKRTVMPDGIVTG